MKKLLFITLLSTTMLARQLINIDININQETNDQLNKFHIFCVNCNKFMEYLNERGYVYAVNEMSSKKHPYRFNVFIYNDDDLEPVDHEEYQIIGQYWQELHPLNRSELNCFYMK